MGIGYSTDYTTESESDSPKKPQARLACKKVLNLFLSPQKDELLDSTDSEITVEENRKINYKGKKIADNKIQPRRSLRRDSENLRIVARDSLAVRRRSTRQDSGSRVRGSKKYKRLSEKHQKSNTNQLSTINSELAENISDKSNKNNSNKSVISLYKEPSKKSLPESSTTTATSIKNLPPIAPTSNISNSINKIVNKFSELGVASNTNKLPPPKGRITASGEYIKDHIKLDEVMPTYQRYSREAPEKDFNKPSEKAMKSCCRSCNCPSRQNTQNNKPRRVSDPYVAVKNSINCNRSPPAVKSAPIAPINIKNQTHQPPSRVPSGQPRIPPPPPLRPQPPINVCDNKTCPHKNPQMYNYGINKQHYPYEEPSDSTYSHETTCCNNCNCYDPCQRHRACKCQCACGPPAPYCPRAISDDQISCCSDSTKTDFMNLAYQRTGDYPELVDELENTLSERNRMRVQKTMQQFEILSRQNKNLDKPIFDDESVHNLKHKCRDDCRCCNKTDTSKCSSTTKSRSTSLSKRPNFQPTPFPRKPGYVEKVARYMDPNHNSARKYSKSPTRNFCNSRNDNGNGTWQRDTSKGEWVKVNNSYDFENSYPPLPPRPRSDSSYCDEKNRHEYANRHSNSERPCTCHTCRRKR